MFGVLILSLNTAAGAAFAATPPFSNAHLLAPGTVRDVGPDGVLTLADGRRVRLSGVVMVTDQLGRGGADGRGDLAEAARKSLRDCVGTGPVAMWAAETEPDRHGVLVIRLACVGGGWARDRLLAAGLAMVRPAPRETDGLETALGLERQARRQDLGAWGAGVFTIDAAADAGALGRRIGKFAIVEGAPRRVTRRGGALYLDFGEDWRRDFSLVVASSVARRLAWWPSDPSTLVGRRLRARGWLTWGFGPRIDIEMGAQLESLD